MRKYIAFLFLLLIATSSSCQNYTKKDKAVFEAYVAQFQDKKDWELCELITQTALFFLETPYVANTLELEPEALTVNLTGLDCTTLVETVLALSQTIKLGEPTFEKFTTQLQNIRYRNGIIEDYSSRIHYTSDWITQNEQKKFVKNITEENGGKEINFTLNFMTANSDKYKQLENNNALIKKIRETEIKASALKNYYIPKTDIEANSAEFKSGDIVAFVTTIKGLDVSHIAFIYKEKSPKERLTFIHASSGEKKVIVEKLTLEQYCLKSKSNKGIIIVRPL